MAKSSAGLPQAERSHLLLCQQEPLPVSTILQPL